MLKFTHFNYILFLLFVCYLAIHKNIKMTSRLLNFEEYFAIEFDVLGVA